jgi:glycerol-3-phosphate acyltransferase PlsY
VNILLAILVGILGYLFGSISFARIITRLFSPQTELVATEAPIEGSEQKLRMHGVSATSVRIQLGNKYGCLTSILDMVKITAPVYGLKTVFPDTYYFLIFAATGLIGHNWPVFSKFIGGYGHSAIYGGLLVIDWTGLLVNFFTTILVVAVTRRLYFALAVGVIVLVPWLAFRSQDWWIVVYAVMFTVVYIIKVFPDFRQYLRIREEDRQAS